MGLAAAPLGLFGLSERRWPWAGAILVGSLAFAVLAFLPAEPFPRLHMSPRLDNAPPEQLVFTALGCGVLIVAVAVIWRLFERPAMPGDLSAPRMHVFLVGWLLGELLGCYAIWTYLASRRVIGLATILILVCARLAAAKPSGGGDRSALRSIAAWGVAVGLLFYVADLCDSRARRDAVRRAGDRLVALGAEPSQESVWYLGHWSFQFYAESLGMKPVVPGRSQLEIGDWLLVPDGVVQQRVRIPPDHVTRVAVVESSSRWPWSSIPSLYAGPIPLRRQPEAQVRVRLYRVERGFQARGIPVHRSPR